MIRTGEGDGRSDRFEGGGSRWRMVGGIRMLAYTNLASDYGVAKHHRRKKSTPHKKTAAHFFYPVDPFSK